MGLPRISCTLLSVCIDRKGRRIANVSVIKRRLALVNASRYRIMTLVPAVDTIMYQSQRQGRISFYMQGAGEEAATVASSAAMMPNDEFFGQYVRHQFCVCLSLLSPRSLSFGSLNAR